MGNAWVFKIILDPNTLKKTVKNGCSQSVWVYYDPKRDRPYGKDSPTPLVQISEDTVLYTLDEARRLFPDKEKGPEPEKEKCPLCGHVDCQCSDGPGPVTTKLLIVTENGSPGKVFQRIADKFYEAEREFIGDLAINCEGVSDMCSLGLAVPQLPKGDYRVEQQLLAEFGDGAADGLLKVEFTGEWSRYKRLRSVLEAQAGEATKPSVRLLLRAAYPDGLAPVSTAYQAMRDVLVQLELGRIEVTATEHAEVLT